MGKPGMVSAFIDAKALYCSDVGRFQPKQPRLSSRLAGLFLMLAAQYVEKGPGKSSNPSTREIMNVRIRVVMFCQVGDSGLQAGGIGVWYCATGYSVDFYEK
jgi:hypothetical protein